MNAVEQAKQVFSKIEDEVIAGKFVNPAQLFTRMRTAALAALSQEQSSMDAVIVQMEALRNELSSRSLHAERKNDEPDVDDRCRYFWIAGWNAFRDAMLKHSPAQSTQGTTRKAYICKSCEGVYADEQVTQCDCMPDKQEFIGGVITYPAQSQEAKDAERWRFSMQFQGDGSDKESPKTISEMWRKVIASGRLRPTREEYEDAIDAAIAATKENG